MATSSKRPQRRCYRIVRNGYPTLRQVAEPIAVIDETIRQIADKMVVTLEESEVPGVGLAAPQVGISKRMIVIDTCSPDDDPNTLSPGELLLNPKMPVVLINPSVAPASDILETANEGCLSLPGVSGDVTRPAEVILQATLLDGSPVTCQCKGLLARCLQHEIDHLDGTLFIDHSPEKQQKAAEPVMRKLAKCEQKYLPKTAAPTQP